MASKRNAVVRRRLCPWHAALGLLRVRDPWGKKTQTEQTYLGVQGSPGVVFVRRCSKGGKGEVVGVVLQPTYRTVCADGVKHREAGKFCAEKSKPCTAELFCSPGLTQQFRESKTAT